MNLDDPILFLATSDASRARTFYERVLDLEFVADEPPALVFRVGGAMLRIQKVQQVHAAPSGALVAWFRDPDGQVLSLTEFRSLGV